MSEIMDGDIKGEALRLATKLEGGLELNRHAKQAISPHVGGLTLLLEALKELNIGSRLHEAKDGVERGAALKALATEKEIKPTADRLLTIGQGNDLLLSAGRKAAQGGDELISHAGILSAHAEKLGRAAELAGSLLELLGEVVPTMPPLQENDDNASSSIQNAVNDVQEWAAQSYIPGPGQ